MTKKQKKTLKRIIAAAVLTVLLALLFHFVELPWFVQLVLWLVPYLVIGHDVLRKAFMGIKNGEIIRVACGGNGRKLIFDDVVVRVNTDGATTMHIDTDEAQAAGAPTEGEIFRA